MTLFPFQSAYSGAPATVDASEVEKEFVISKVGFTGNRKPIYVRKKRKQKINVQNQLDAIVAYIHDYCNKEGIKKLADICMPPLPETLYFDAGKRVDSDEVFVTFGLVDDPDHQSQMTHKLNITAMNYMLIGSTQTGKTNFLQTAIRSLTEHYSPDEVNIYIVDFASMILKNFENLNHVGGVVLSHEDEKVKNLFRLLSNEIDLRKSRLAEVGVSSFASYKEAGYRDLPQIVVVIDNLTALKELYLQDNDMLLPVCRDGNSVGISFLVANGQTAGVGYRYLNNFEGRIALFCNESSEYTMLFEGNRTKLPNVPGRALVQIDKATYECQMYLAFDGDKEYERVQNIQKYVTSCNERYVGMNARVIPEIPKCLDIGYVEKHYAQANTNDELMIGLDYETIEPLSMNLNENDMIVLSGKKDVSRKAFAKYIISVFADKKFGKTELYVLDTLAGKWGELEILPQTAYYTTDADSSISIVTEIGQIVEQRYQNYINRRSNLQDESWIVVIVDNNDAILALSSNKNAMATLKDIWGKYSGMKVIFVFTDINNASIPFNAPEIMKIIKERKKYIIFDEISNIKTNGRIIEVVNAREIHAVKNEYDKKYRVTKQFFPDGGMMSFLYDDEKRCVVLTERNGVKTTYFYDENYRNTETVFEDGTSEKFLYNEKNQCISKTDRLGRTQRMAYDNRGNLTQVVDSLKRRINFTYDANNNLISVSMNGKERLKNHYDVKGKLIATENCMKESLWITYDEKQHPVELTFVDGSKTMLSYDERGNISTIREANGNEVHYIYDELNRVVETRDVNNNSTKYKYDLRGKITKVINPLGDTREYTYDKAGRVTGIKDFDGFWTLSTYNAIGKIETITDKEAHVTTYGYDKMWNITSQTMPDGTIQAFKYDEDNRLSLVEYPNGGTNTYTYDSVGNRTSVTDAEGNTTAYVYDAENQLVEVIEPDGAKTKKTYDRDGNLVAVTNAMDHVTSYTYDDLGRRISRTNAEGATTSLFYNNMGQVERVCHPNGTQTFYTYDLGGRVKSVKNPDGSGEIYEYDLKGNLISRANGMEDKISFKYDALDRLVEIVNQVEGVRKFTYDAVGNLTSIIDEKGNKTTYDYSPNGNLMKVTDALGNETFYEYDAMNRLVKTLCTGANGEESQNTDFVWDVMGQIKSVTDPLGYVESYEYDKNGNMTSKTDRDGYTINFTYGSHGKIEEIVYADGKTVEMSYDALRRLNEVKDWNGITKITLDAIGRALSVTEPNGDTVGYEWGLMGEKKAVIYPNGKRAEYSYNTEMQLVSLHTERETIQYAYDEIGRLTKKILPNGIETNYHYNAMGRVDEISHIGNEFAESYKYSFDIYGNKVSAIKNRVGAEVDNGHFAYVYDELNRLTEVHQNDTLLRKYSYDAFGNRVSKANYASRMESVTSYTYNVNNQLLSEVDGTMTKDYTYDNRGNLLKVSTGADILKEFTFDATNQMTASFDLVDGQRKKATYTYNGLGHRVGQKISSLIPEYPEKKIRYTIDMTRQYYNLLQKSEGGASQTYYWDGNVVGMESNGVEKFYLQDDFGSPMHLVDIYGTSQECFAFDEFGENLSTSYNNTSQTFGFTGYQTDEVGDLYYAQARRYDASVGRFVSEDKVRGFVILPYTLNHYGYCWNNPVDFVDRDGNLPTVVIGAVIGLAAGALGEVVSQTIDGVQSGKSVLDSLLDVNPGKVVLEAGKGAVTGAVAGTGAGLLVVAGTSGVVEFGGDLLDQKVLQKKEDLDYTHAISNGLWSATTTLVVGGITNEISNVIHPEAKTGTMDYLFGRDKAKAVVKAQYNNARSSSSRAKYWNRLEKIKLQKTLGTIKYGIIETGKTIIDEIKNEIYRDEVNEDIVEEIDKKISCSVY